MNGLREMGLSVPDDVSVASFDGSVFSEITSPKLSGVRQDAAEIGRALADKLMRLIEDENCRQEIIVIPAQIRFTESCRALK